MASKNFGLRQVTVNDSHRLRPIWVLKAAGLPNSGRPAAIFSHSVQPWLSALVMAGGGASMVPRLVASVIEPFWQKTRSSAATSTVSTLPARSRVRRVTRWRPASVAISMSVTTVSPTKFTPRSRSQRSSGTTMASYWL